MTRISKSEHRKLPWRIHELVPGFTLEDVWRIQTPGAGPDDFDTVIGVVHDVGASPRSRIARGLFALRRRLGAILGWDLPGDGIDGRVESLRTGVEPEWNAEPLESEAQALLSPIYRLPTEAASEMANKTVHGVLHFGWLQGPDGEWELQIAVYAKPHGTLGLLYMVAIAPFRYAVVWPAMVRAWERGWAERKAVRGGVLALDAAPTRLSISPTYLDRFILNTDVRASPQRWAEATFEEGIKRSERHLIFGTILGLEIGPDGRPGRVAGWRILTCDTEHVLLQARGTGSIGELLIEVDPGSVSLTTAFVFTARRRAAVWKQVSRMHRRLAAPTLRNGARLLQSFE